MGVRSTLAPLCCSRLWGHHTTSTDVPEATLPSRTLISKNRVGHAAGTAFRSQDADEARYYYCRGVTRDCWRIKSGNRLNNFRCVVCFVVSSDINVKFGNYHCQLDSDITVYYNFVGNVKSCQCHVQTGGVLNVKAQSDF